MARPAALNIFLQKCTARPAMKSTRIAARLFSRNQLSSHRLSRVHDPLGNGREAAVRIAVRIVGR